MQVPFHLSGYLVKRSVRCAPGFFNVYTTHIFLTFSRPEATDPGLMEFSFEPLWKADYRFGILPGG
jgi:hypothetical protein